MKRWAIGSIAFFAAIFFGTVFTVGLVKVSDLITYSDGFDPQYVQAIETPAPDTPSTSIDLPAIFNPTIDYAKTLPVKLLFPGEFHFDEVPYRSGERWLGLFRERDETILKWTTIDIKRGKDPILQDTEVSVRNSSSAIFLLKGAKELQLGNVDTMFDAEDHADFTIDDCSDLRSSFRIRGSFWRLCNENSYGNGFPKKSSSLNLSGPAFDPVSLTSLPDDCDDCSWKLVWVGDLDNDSRPDFLIDVSSHYNSYEPTLFLSSKDYAVYASFHGVGC